MLVAVSVVLLHAALVWGHLSIFWGDNGRWLFELDRVAHGARIYRDVFWAFPPLTMWLFGPVLRVIGTDLVPVWTLTMFVALLLAATYGKVVARLVPAPLVMPVAGVGMLLGAAYSQQLSAPLALGMYSPAVPMAALVLMLQLSAFLSDWDAPTVRGAMVVGALGGLGILAKQDVWFAGAWLTLACGLLVPDTAHADRRRLLAAGGAFAAVAVAGVGTLAVQHAVSALGPIFTGFGHVEEFRGMNLPDLSMLTVEVTTFGLCLAGLAVIAWVSGAWRDRRCVVLLLVGAALVLAATGIWLWRCEVVARELMLHPGPALRTPFEANLLPVSANGFDRARRAFGALRVQMVRHALPLLLPAFVLAVVVLRRGAVGDPRRWRLVVILLVGCLLMRARRMVSFTEWSSCMLEVPVYVMAADVLSSVAKREVIRAVRMATAALLLVALIANWQLGYGLGSRRGRLPAVETLHGTARLSVLQAADLAFLQQAADQIDPGRSRPVQAFGYSGGLSYWLGRPSTTSLTQGFRLSLYPSPDSAYRAAATLKPQLILVDNSSYDDGITIPRFAPWRWLPEQRLNHYSRVDRPLFDRLSAGCTRVTPATKASTIFMVYDCASAPAKP